MAKIAEIIKRVFLTSKDRTPIFPSNNMSFVIFFFSGSAFDSCHCSSKCPHPTDDPTV
jgi:hypothetical protein